VVAEGRAHSKPFLSFQLPGVASQQVSTQQSLPSSYWCGRRAQRPTAQWWAALTPPLAGNSACLKVNTLGEQRTECGTAHASLSQASTRTTLNTRPPTPPLARAGAGQLTGWRRPASGSRPPRPRPPAATCSPSQRCRPYAARRASRAAPGLRHAASVALVCSNASQTWESVVRGQQGPGLDIRGAEPAFPIACLGSMPTYLGAQRLSRCPAASACLRCTPDVQQAPGSHQKHIICTNTLKQARCVCRALPAAELC